MIDIVEALLNAAEDYEKKYYFPCNLNRTAAAEISRLRAEIATIRGQTAQACAEIADNWGQGCSDDSAAIVAEKIADSIRERFGL